MARDTQTFSARRLEALTDGVFAIAMTLLVLDLKVPELGEAATNHQLWQALGNMQTIIGSFVVSFLVLGSMWAVHVRQFEYITKADRHLTMINTLRLLVVVTIPFTTNLNGTYPDLTLANLLFGLNFLILALVSWWQWSYATRQGSTLCENITKNEIVRARNRNIVISGMMAIIIILSLFIGQAAFLVFVFTGPILVLFTRHIKDTPQKSQR